MKIYSLLVLLALLLGCSGEDSNQPTVVGSWFYDRGTSGWGLNLEEDMTYASLTLVLTSQTSARVEGRKGTYVSTGSELTLTTLMSSCPGEPRSVDTIKYQQKDNESLSLVTPEGAIFLVRNHEAAADQGVITFGCFDSEGGFTESPLVNLQ